MYCYSGAIYPDKIILPACIILQKDREQTNPAVKNQGDSSATAASGERRACGF